MKKNPMVSRFLKALADYWKFACGDLKYTEDSRAIKIAAKRPDQTYACNVYRNPDDGLIYVEKDRDGSKGTLFNLVEKKDGTYDWIAAYHRVPDGTSILVKDGQKMTPATEAVDADWAWHHDKYSPAGHLANLRERYKKAVLIDQLLDRIGTSKNLHEVLEAGKYKDWDSFVSVMLPGTRVEWPDCGAISCWLAAESDRINGRPKVTYCY